MRLVRSFAQTRVMSVNLRFGSIMSFANTVWMRLYGKRRFRLRAGEARAMSRADAQGYMDANLGLKMYCLVLVMSVCHVAVSSHAVQGWKARLVLSCLDHILDDNKESPAERDTPPV